MFHIIGAMAEFERDVISERTLAGLDAARARGRCGGRPKAIEKIEPRNLARAKELYTAKNNTIAEIMQMTGFRSRNTFINRKDYERKVQTSETLIQAAMVRFLLASVGRKS